MTALVVLLALLAPAFALSALLLLERVERAALTPHRSLETPVPLGAGRVLTDPACCCNEMAVGAALGLSGAAPRGDP